MLKPICIKCERFFRPKKNGVYFVEGMPIEDGALAGKAEPDKWQPYKLWSGDSWECPDCHAEVIVGVGFNPVAEHYQTHFTARVAALNAELVVKDC